MKYKYIHKHIRTKRILLKGLIITMFLSLITGFICSGCQNNGDESSSLSKLITSESISFDSRAGEQSEDNNLDSTNPGDKSEDGIEINSSETTDSKSPGIGGGSGGGTDNNPKTSSLPSLAKSSKTESIPTSSQPEIPDSSYTIGTNYYDKKDKFIIILDASKPPYNADKSGSKDSTTAIQTAINQCQTRHGGGIVFLPRGKYKVSDTINMKSHVILKGEYNDPDKTSEDYGTVLIAEITKSLFFMNAASGVSGLTVYYPNQSINSYKDTDYTFRAESGNFTLENITLINSNKGVGVCVDGGKSHGLVRLSNIKGTVLKQGINMKFGSEVSFIDTVYLSPKYWGNTKLGKKENETDIRNWMNANSSSGLSMAGLEGPGYSNLTLDGFKTGVESLKTPRGDGAEAYAQFYNLNVSNSEIAADFQYTYTDMGMLIAESSLSGSQYSIKNSSQNVIKVFNSSLNGNTTGKIEKTTADVSHELIIKNTPVPAKNNLYVVTDSKYGADKDGRTNSSNAIQKALNDAKNAGGGYVYLPGGIYRMEDPITVYADTVLLGSNAVAGADVNIDYAGTVIFAYYGKGKSASDKALITLSGANSGCSGIRFYYPLNGVTVQGATIDNNVDPYAYTIRGLASGVFCENLNFYATYHGIEMKSADNYLIKNCAGSFYKNAYKISDSNGGMIAGCLSNNGQQGFGVAFSYLPDFKDWMTVQKSGSNAMYEYLLHGVGRKYHDYIIYNNSKNQKLYNTFAYIPKNFLIATNSEIISLNIYGSRMGNENSLLTLSGGRIVSVNNYLKLSKVAVFSNQAKAGIYNIKGQILASTVSENNIER